MGLLGKLLALLFGWFANRGRANITEIADSHARAQEHLAQERAANEVQAKSAAARSAADTRIVRTISENPTDTADAIARKFPDNFRD
jgi:hypothetical protein